MKAGDFSIGIGDYIASAVISVLDGDFGLLVQLCVRVWLALDLCEQPPRVYQRNEVCVKVAYPERASNDEYIPWG